MEMECRNGKDGERAEDRNGVKPSVEMKQLTGGVTNT